LNTIIGQPPDLANLPSGCSFHPRCPFAKPQCMQSKPELEEISPNHFRACFGYEG
jgi:oligopeptide transport system ATP-binding protein